MAYRRRPAVRAQKAVLLRQSPTRSESCSPETPAAPMAMLPPGMPVQPEACFLDMPTNPSPAQPDTSIVFKPLLPAVVPRRDKSLSALSHELIQSYGQDGKIVDLEEVQVRDARGGIFPPRPSPRRPPMQSLCCPPTCTCAGKLHACSIGASFPRISPRPSPCPAPPSCGPGHPRAPCAHRSATPSGRSAACTT
jgi:hypothetical protein